MALTPRGEEVASVVDVLEGLADGKEDGEEYSVEDVARAVFLRVAWLLSLRDAHAVVLNRRYAHGPFYSEAGADKLITQLGGAPGEPTKVPLFSSGLIMGKVTDEGLAWTGFCLCRHPRDMHLADGSTRGKCGYTLSEQCDCEKFVEVTPKKTARKTKKKAETTAIEDAAA